MKKDSNKDCELREKIKEILFEDFYSTSTFNSPSTPYQSPSVVYSSPDEKSSYELNPKETAVDKAKRLNIPYSPILKKIDKEDGEEDSDMELLSKLAEIFRKTGKIEIKYNTGWHGPMFQYIVEFLGMEYKNNKNDKAILRLMDVFDGVENGEVREMFKYFWNGTSTANKNNTLIENQNSPEVLSAAANMKRLGVVQKIVDHYISKGGDDFLFKYLIKHLQLRFYKEYELVLKREKASLNPKELGQAQKYATNYYVSDILKYLYQGNDENEKNDNFIKFDKANKEIISVLNTQKIHPKHLAVIDGIIDGKLDNEEVMDANPGLFINIKDVARNFSQAIRTGKIGNEILGDFLDRIYKKHGLELPSTKTWTTKDIASNQDTTKKLKDDKMDFVFEIRKEVRRVLKEYMTSSDLRDVEQYADSMFKDTGVDIEFTRHFIDRVNDPRNYKEIETQELKDLFKKLYFKYGQKLPNFKKGTHAVVSDMNSNINIPIELRWDDSTKSFEMMNMTVMRKKNFFTNDMTLKV